MRFTVEDLADFGRIILQKYPILKEFNPLVDYPYENERISRLTIEIANINDLVRLQNDLDNELLVRSDCDTTYNNEKDILHVLEINNS
jgi:hypothetical protein